MKWYLAKMVYRIICGDGRHTPQFDEQLRLIVASNGSEAFDKAVTMGMKEQESFLNQKNELGAMAVCKCSGSVPVEQTN